MSADELTFQTTIGVDVKGEMWNCIEIPDSVGYFGSGKSARVDATIDGVTLENVGAMPTGSGGHMVSLSAKVRARLGKSIGDGVSVTITKR